MKDATLKVYLAFMENFIGPLVKNEKFILALLLLALGGGLYTVADLLGLTHAKHDEPEKVVEVAPVEVVPTTRELPIISEGTHYHDNYALRNHTHPQKNWVPIIKKSQSEVKEELFEEYHK